MYCFAEEPCRSQLIIKRNHGRETRCLIKQVEKSLHKIVGLNRAARHINYRDAGPRAKVPAKIIGQPHAARCVPGHRMNPSIGRAGSSGNDRPRFWRQSINPFTRGNGLARIGVGTLSRPISCFLDSFVWNRSFDDEDERIDLSSFGLIEKIHKLIADLRCKDGIMEMYLWESWDRPQQKIFNAGLLGGGDRDCVAVASQTSREPDYVNLFHIRGPFTEP